MDVGGGELTGADGGDDAGLVRGCGGQQGVEFGEALADGGDVDGRRRVRGRGGVWWLASQVRVVRLRSTWSPPPLPGGGSTGGGP